LGQGGLTARDVISCIPETVSQPREIPHVGTWGRVAGSQPPPFHLALNIFPILKLLPRHRLTRSGQWRHSRLIDEQPLGQITRNLPGVAVPPSLRLIEKLIQVEVSHVDLH
jgi:hypothetical protein